MWAVVCSQVTCEQRVAKTSVYYFCLGGPHDEILQKPGRPLRSPTYLPTYLPYLWETKKEIIRWVKVGYYTN